MGDQRHTFRFRLPWLSAAATSRPAAQTQAPSQPTTTTEPQPRPAAQTQAPSQPTTTIEPQPRPRPAAQTQASSQPTTTIEPQPQPQPRPAAQTQAPSQPTTTIPIPRTPFRPAWSSPVQTIPTQAQAPPQKTEPQPAAASRATTEPKATSQPATPARLTNQIRASSVPPSPSRRATETQVTSQPAGQTSSQPSSPSHRATQVQTLSPPKRSAMATQLGSQPPSSTQSLSSASQEPTFKPFVTEAGTETRELLGAALETGKRHQEKQEDIERKKTWTTSSTDEKQIKTVSSAYPKDQRAPNNSHQKHVTSNWEKVPLHKEIKEDISKFVHKLATGQPKLPTDEKSISVLTLAGENTGASFYLGSESAKKDGLVHIHWGFKINSDDSPDATTDGEGSSRGRKPKDSTTKENQAPRAYVNSNTQSINNSIVFESSLNERSSGVHLDFLHNLAESTKSSAKAEPLELCKAEFNITQAEKLTYEPTVRRRCFRGLSAESSDSDPDNP